MTAPAIAMMLVAMVVLWGGLALAIFNLSRHDPPTLDEIHRDL
jgi:hypothetical protein